MCVPLYNNVKPILNFISIQEVFISIFNSDSVVKSKQNQKAGKVSQPFLKTVNLGALSIWEPSTRNMFVKIKIFVVFPGQVMRMWLLVFNFKYIYTSNKL